MARREGRLQECFAQTLHDLIPRSPCRRPSKPNEVGHFDAWEHHGILVPVVKHFGSSLGCVRPWLASVRPPARPHGPGEAQKRGRPRDCRCGHPGPPPPANHRTPPPPRPHRPQPPPDTPPSVAPPPKPPPFPPSPPP